MRRPGPASAIASTNKLPARQREIDIVRASWYQRIRYVSPQTDATAGSDGSGSRRSAEFPPILPRGLGVAAPQSGQSLLRKSHHAEAGCRRVPKGAGTE